MRSSTADEIMAALDTAWPKECLAACGVDFIRDERGLPKPTEGAVWTGVTLVSLDWGLEKVVWITRPLTEFEKIAAQKVNGRWYVATGGQLSERFDAAIAELREPPPLWVDP